MKRTPAHIAFLAELHNQAKVGWSATESLWNRNYRDRAAIRLGIIRGEIAPGKLRGLGKLRFARLCAWAGLDAPAGAAVRRCPHCGKLLSSQRPGGAQPLPTPETP